MVMDKIENVEIELTKDDVEDLYTIMLLWTSDMLLKELDLRKEGKNEEADHYKRQYNKNVILRNKLKAMKK